MNRLTNHDRWSDDIDLTNEYGYKYIYDRLAEYENTGLTPDEIKAMQWISVKDRLPPKDKDVVIYFDRCGGEVGIAYQSKRTDAWYKYGTLLCYNVTHWMPLPELPKGELK